MATEATDEICEGNTTSREEIKKNVEGAKGEMKAKDNENAGEDTRLSRMAVAVAHLGASERELKGEGTCQ